MSMAPKDHSAYNAGWSDGHREGVEAERRRQAKSDARTAAPENDMTDIVRALDLAAEGIALDHVRFEVRRATDRLRDHRCAPSVAAPSREDERRTAIAISVEAALCHEKVHDSGGGDDAPVVWFDACDHSSEPEWPCRAAYGVADALLAGTARDPERAT